MPVVLECAISRATFVHVLQDGLSTTVAQKKTPPATTVVNDTSLKQHKVGTRHAKVCFDPPPITACQRSFAGCAGIPKVCGISPARRRAPRPAPWWCNRVMTTNHVYCHRPIYQTHVPPHGGGNLNVTMCSWCYQLRRSVHTHDDDVPRCTCMENAVTGAGSRERGGDVYVCMHLFIYK